MTKTVRRTPKSVRLVDQDVQLLSELHAALPQHPTEADVLAEASHLGLLVLAAEAAVADQSIGTIAPLVLAQRLRTRLLPVFELLAQHGALPALLTQALGSAPSVVNAAAPTIPAASLMPEPSTPPPAVSAEAGADVRSGSGKIRCSIARPAAARSRSRPR